MGAAKDIDAGLDELRRILVEAGIQSVAIPPLGCGNGGLDWSDVLPLIDRKLDGLDIDILVFAPDGAPHPAEMKNRTARPELSADKPLTVSEFSHAVRRPEVATPMTTTATT